MKSKDYKIKEIEFPKDLYEKGEKIATSLGLTFEEYVIHLVEKDLTSQKVKNPMPFKPSRFYAKDEEEIRRGF